MEAISEMLNNGIMDLQMTTVKVGVVRGLTQSQPWQSGRNLCPRLVRGSFHHAM